MMTINNHFCNHMSIFYLAQYQDLMFAVYKYTTAMHVSTLNDHLKKIRQIRIKFCH